jgi:hypothetical protein
MFSTCWRTRTPHRASPSDRGMMPACHWWWCGWMGRRDDGDRLSRSVERGKGVTEKSTLQNRKSVGDKTRSVAVATKKSKTFFFFAQATFALTPHHTHLSLFCNFGPLKSPTLSVTPRRPTDAARAPPHSTAAPVRAGCALPCSSQRSSHVAPTTSRHAADAIATPRTCSCEAPAVRVTSGEGGLRRRWSECCMSGCACPRCTTRRSCGMNAAESGHAHHFLPEEKGVSERGGVLKR